MGTAFWLLFGKNVNEVKEFLGIGLMKEGAFPLSIDENDVEGADEDEKK